MQFLDGISLFLLRFLPLINFYFQFSNNLFQFFIASLVLLGFFLQFLQLFFHELILNQQFLVFLLLKGVLHLESQFIIHLLDVVSVGVGGRGWTDWRDHVGGDKGLGQPAAHEGRGLFNSQVVFVVGFHSDHGAVFPSFLPFGVIKKDLLILLRGQWIFINQFKFEFLVLHLIQPFLITVFLNELVDLDKRHTFVFFSFEPVMSFNDHFEQFHRTS